MTYSNMQIVKNIANINIEKSMHNTSKSNTSQYITIQNITNKKLFCVFTLFRKHEYAQ